jgi:acyl-CoA reductase-like NAD-dependent aldehyde dehydrogenase
MGMISFKTAPALATGNVMILKPSEKTPFSALRFASLVADVLPPGVIQVLPGAGETGNLLAHHMRVRKISFTGSGQVGRKIQRAAAESNLKCVTLELGGKTK